MNYSDLAARLSQLGERLAKQSDKLEGENLGRSAGKLSLQLQRFEEELESHLASRKSGELLLESLLRSPASKRHLTLALLKHGLREICGKRLRSEELAAAKREFIELVHAAGKQDHAVEFLRTRIRGGRARRIRGQRQGASAARILSPGSTAR